MNEDKIINKLIEHEDRFDRIESQLGETLKREEFLRVSDDMMTILKRIDDERHFTAEWIRRVEEDLKQTRKIVELHELEFKAVKERLAM